jgi:tRNA threonylcarbamoyladenosine biosynthesis protein TsaE
VIIATEEEMRSFGKRLAAQLRPGDCVAIDGPLGAGKTVLCSAILAGLGFAGEVASPSYALVHRYDPPDLAIAVTHADLYRLDDASELDELALDDERELRILLIEWAERVDSRYLRPSHLIKILHDADGSRILKLNAERENIAD